MTENANPLIVGYSKYYDRQQLAKDLGKAHKMDKAMLRFQEADSNRVNSNLDDIVNDNPSLSRERIAFPPEMHDWLHESGVDSYRSEFKNAGSCVQNALITGAIASFVYYFSQNHHFFSPEYINFETGMNTFLEVSFGIISTIYLGLSVAFTKSGITDYIAFKKTPFFKTLNDEERKAAEKLYSIELNYRAYDTYY